MRFLLFIDRISLLEDRVEKLERKVSVKLYSATHREFEPLQENMLTSDAAATYLGITKVGLLKMTQKKLIPYYKPNGKNIYFDREELDAWMHRGRQEAVNG